MHKLRPTAAQQLGLERYLWVTRTVYNAALEQRIAAYKGAGVTLGWITQSRDLTAVREAGLLKGVHVHAVQHALKQLNLAYAAFFRRIQAGAARAGFPRFKGARYWRSVHFKEHGNGARLDTAARRLRVSGVGAIRVRVHRELPRPAKTVTLVRKADGWYAHVLCDTGSAPPLRPARRSVGIDVGLKKFAVLSTGEQIPNPRHLRAVEHKRARAARELSRRQRGSSRREKARQRLALLDLKLAGTRRDHHHKLARDLVQRCDRIAVEDLAVTAIRAAGGAHKRGLNKSMSDAAWGQFLQILAAKCEQAGVELARVDPRYTSQTCSACGQLARKQLSDRWHTCTCGCSLDCDHNAAINIEHRAWAAPLVEAA